VPDLSTYIDLSLDDRSAIDLFAAARLGAATKLPGYEWVESSLPAIVLEAMAQIGAEIIFAVNRLPDALVTEMGARVGVIYDAGEYAQMSVTFSLVGPTGGTIPAGTLVEATTTAGALVYELAGPLVIPIGQSIGSGLVRALARTSVGNGIPASTPLRLVTPTPIVTSVVTATVSASGRDPETPAAYNARVATVLSRLTSTLVLPDHFAAYALGTAGVGRAYPISLYDGVGGPPYTQPGHITVVACDANGVALAPATVTALELAMQSAATAALQVHVIGPTITAVDVTVAVKPSAGYLPAQVQADVIAALTDYLSPTRWPWSGTVRRTELIAAVNAVDGVDYCDLPTIPAGDVALAGDGPLATAGTITVTILP
jgi:uncharacterized phage protein gp47/JayE